MAGRKRRLYKSAICLRHDSVLFTRIRKGKSTGRIRAGFVIVIDVLQPDGFSWSGKKNRGTGQRPAFGIKDLTSDRRTVLESELLPAEAIVSNTKFRPILCPVFLSLDSQTEENIGAARKIIQPAVRAGDRVDSLRRQPVLSKNIDRNNRED